MVIILSIMVIILSIMDNITILIIIISIILSILSNFSSGPHMAKKTTGSALQYFARLIRCRSRLNASGACRAVMTHCRARIRKGTDQASGEKPW